MKVVVGINLRPISSAEQCKVWIFVSDQNNLQLERLYACVLGERPMMAEAHHQEIAGYGTIESTFSKTDQLCQQIWP